MALYTINPDGNSLARLTNDSVAEDLSAMAWSLDSQRIVFSSNRDGDWELYIMNADGSNQARLTFLPGEEWGPVWVP